MMDRFYFALIVGLSLLPGLSARGADYDPLSVGKETLQHVDLTIHDARRNRDIPVRVYLPPEKKNAAVVIFSHGLGGSREGYVYLGEHWAARGYLCVFVQHIGSDDSVWKDKPISQRIAAMNQAASIENLVLRVRDIPAVIDQLEIWNREEGNALLGTMNLDRIGMAGHSFGAITTQMVSGQQNPTARSFTDVRIKAAVIMSPSSPQTGDPKRAFAHVQIPWMLMTGTNDVAPIGNTDLKSRLAVFPALPTGDKFELVLDKAEHSVFSDRALPGDVEPRNPSHHRAILAITTAFWDAYLNKDDSASAWLKGDAVKKILAEKDHWQTK